MGVAITLSIVNFSADFSSGQCPENRLSVRETWGASANGNDTREIQQPQPRVRLPRHEHVGPGSGPPSPGPTSTFRR